MRKISTDQGKESSRGGEGATAVTPGYDLEVEAEVVSIRFSSSKPTRTGRTVADTHLIGVVLPRVEVHPEYSRFFPGKEITFIHLHSLTNRIGS